MFFLIIIALDFTFRYDLSLEKNIAWSWLINIQDKIGTREKVSRIIEKSR